MKSLPPLCRGDEGEEGMNETDGLGDLAHALSVMRSGFHRIEGPGGVAVFPMQAANEAEWEARALAQAQAAERLEVATRPVAKPSPDGIRRVTRSD